MTTRPNASTLRLVTVYIRPDFYQRFFVDNPVVSSLPRTAIDNRAQNLGLPTHYNAVIETHLADDLWLFFVHEDFQIKGGLEVIDQLDPGHIYGTFGIDLQNRAPVPYGRHTCSDKDGSHAVEVGIPVHDPVSVQTIDCQSILIHTSLLRRQPRLRFDEALRFDLYAEDLSICARERCGIDVRVFPLHFQHYSHGNITDRYHAGLRYLAAKYPQTAVAGSCSFIGGRAHELERHFTYAIRANAGAPGTPPPLRRRFLDRLRRTRAALRRWLQRA